MMKLENTEITRTRYSEDRKTKAVVSTAIDTFGKKTTTHITYINGNESSYKKEYSDGSEERYTYIQNLDESGKPDQYQTVINHKHSDGSSYTETIKRYKTGKFSADGRKNWSMGECVNITSSYETVRNLCSRDESGNIEVDAREGVCREYFNEDKIVRTITEEDSVGDTLIITDYEYPVCGCVFKTTHSTDYGSPKCRSNNVLTINVDKLCTPTVAGINRFIEAKGGTAAIDVLNLKGTRTYQEMMMEADYTFFRTGAFFLSLTVVSGEHRDSKFTIDDGGNLYCECATHSEKPDEGDIVDTFIWAIHGPLDIKIPSISDMLSSLTTIKIQMIELFPKKILDDAFDIKGSFASDWNHSTTLYFPNAEIKTTKHYIAANDGEKENKTETTPTTEPKPKAPNKAEGKVSVKRTSLKKELCKKGKVTVYEQDYVSEYNLNMISSTRRERS